MLDLALNKFNLKPGEVQVWKVNISLLKGVDFTSILSIPEIDRAAKFRFEQDRERFLACRGILRILLGGYLSLTSGKIKFNFSKFGKPGLAGRQELRFNISHAKNMAILGFTLLHDLGVDIEYHNPDIDVREIAQRFFSEKEKKELLSLSSKPQIDAFYRCWTRKESFIKALGGGLSIPLDRFSVSIMDNMAPSLLDLDFSNMKTSDWTIIDCSPDAHYSAAVAVKCMNPTFLIRDFNEYHVTESNWSGH